MKASIRMSAPLFAIAITMNTGIAFAEPTFYPADALINQSGGNIYSIGSGVILKVLDAIFGSSASTANYTNIQNVDITDNYAETKKITKSWITSYIK